MNNVTFIDTRPGKSLFAAPKGEPDYMGWIKNRYKKQFYKDGDSNCCFGMAQNLHAVLQAKDLLPILIIGKHAKELATFILVVANELNKNIEIEVLT